MLGLTMSKGTSLSIPVGSYPLARRASQGNHCLMTNNIHSPVWSTETER